MQKKYRVLFFLLFFLLGRICGMAAISKDTLTASLMHPFGRYALDPRAGLELISSAAHFGFSFNGSNCRLFAHINDTGEHNYLQYTLDGKYQRRIRISGNQL